MTKRRQPLTFENALTKVAALIGWKSTARICGRAERTVRNWSEPDTTAEISLEEALELDTAFLAAGGDCAPFLLCYSTRIDAAAVTACPSREALIAGAGVAAREHGQAIAATLAAASPDASDADFILAERELEEAIVAHTASLAALRAARTAPGQLIRPAEWHHAARAPP